MDSNILFFLLSFVILFFSLNVFLSANPLISSLYLVMSMIGVAFIFFLLDAAFLAGVQLAVYAGAVMVLFVMVLMLFDIKSEVRAFSRGFISRGVKMFSGFFLLGLLANAIFLTTEAVPPGPVDGVEFSSKYLAAILFTDYLFAFEVLGVVLLVIAIGAVALSRIKGGTHAK